jgi:hypothetical protein
MYPVSPRSETLSDRICQESLVCEKYNYWSNKFGTREVSLNSPDPKVKSIIGLESIYASPIKYGWSVKLPYNKEVFHSLAEKTSVFAHIYF